MADSTIDINAYIAKVNELNYKYAFSVDGGPSSGDPDLPLGFTQLTASQVYPLPVLTNNRAPDDLQVFNFFKSLYIGGNYQDRASWAAFSTAWNNALGLPTVDAFASNNPLYSGLINNFKIMMGIPFDPDTNGLGDLAPLEPIIQGEAKSDFVDRLFKENFEYFIGHYDWAALDATGHSNTPTGTPVSNPGDPGARLFAEAWRDFLVSRTGVLNTYLVPSETPTSAPGTSFGSGAKNQNLSVYKSLFDNFVGPNPPAPFDSVVQKFYQDMIKTYGYFNPSQQLTDWIKVVQTQSAIVNDKLSSVTGTHSKKALILSDIFALLVQVIDTLQKLTAAQGSRLTFYAQYQEAYTNLIAQIPIVNQQEVVFFGLRSDGGGNDTKNQASMGFVQAQNSSFTERLRSYRDAIASQAQSQQTTVNQSNDIVQQEANMANAILQQMGTILMAMFK